MLRDILYQYNPWWEGEFQCNYIRRAVYLQQFNEVIERKTIEMLTGLRRVGKTALMKLLIEQLLRSNLPNRIMYLTMDAFGIEKYSIHEILEEFRKIHKHSRDTHLYLFLDEIIAKPSYQQELKNFYDNENVKIFVSASQAGLLKDQRSDLTGRVRIHEILPLRFDEYLHFKKITVKRSEHYLIERYFEDYMNSGGMPEYVMTGDVGYLNELCENILYKDIVVAYGIKDSSLIRDYFRLLMERSGKQASINKIANILGISPDTSKRYMEYFLNTYLIHAVERCGKINERIRSGKKIYAGDVGIRNIITGFRDKGAIFENLVYLVIKQHDPCYVYHEGTEIDFRTKDHLIEVKYGSEMTQKQMKLYEEIPVERKYILNSVDSFLSYAGIDID